jgi:hypothetical protein
MDETVGGSFGNRARMTGVEPDGAEPIDTSLIARREAGC